MAVTVDIKALLEAGVHFGHKTSRWHPKMAPYIHSKRQDSHIIDLTKTVSALEKALPVITDTVASGKQVLLVGTKRQAQDIVKAAAEKTGQPFVTERWMGGMLTNTTTMVSRIKHLKTLERKMDSGELANRYNKLEVQRFQEEIDDLNKKYGGIKDLDGKPGLVVVTDVIEDQNAVSEAVKLGVPVVGIVDTNADPSRVTYPVPANDDAIKGIQLIVDYIVAAIEEGNATSSKKEGK
tara:strand:+ start:254 stop:964 length:711 start_codon:yes stop_codon:yes gene_type:complete